MTVTDMLFLSVHSFPDTMFGEDDRCGGVKDVDDIEDIVTQDDDITTHVSTKELILPHARTRTKATGQRIEECMQADSIIPGRLHHTRGCNVLNTTLDVCRPDVKCLLKSQIRDCIRMQIVKYFLLSLLSGLISPIYPVICSQGSTMYLCRLLTTILYY